MHFKFEVWLIWCYVKVPILFLTSLDINFVNWSRRILILILCFNNKLLLVGNQGLGHSVKVNLFNAASCRRLFHFAGIASNKCNYAQVQNFDSVKAQYSRGFACGPMLLFSHVYASYYFKKCLSLCVELCIQYPRSPLHFKRYEQCSKSFPNVLQWHLWVCLQSRSHRQAWYICSLPWERR